MELSFRIFRFDPEQDKEPRYQRYTVQAAPEERLLDCLNRIRWEQDGTLAYRMSCAHGVCGSDAMRINGRCALACQKLARDYEGSEVTLEPLPTFRVVKDLIVDLDPFFKRIEQLRPYIQPASDPPEKERPQTPEERKRIDEVIRCILCACCTGQCPVEQENGEFLGPAALVWAYRTIFDSRDARQAERLEQLDHPNGAWACENLFECTRVCPKEIQITRSIDELKSEIRPEEEPPTAVTGPAPQKEFTREELASCDGKEGRPVYVAHAGRVFDVSGSRLWRGGQHMRRHQAGADLTADLAAAPHGPDRLDSFPQVGTLAPEPLPQEPRGAEEALLDRFPSLRRHPHPMTVHFPLVFAVAAPIFALLQRLTGVSAFGVTASHCLWALCLTAPVGIVTGYFSWRINYGGRPLHQVKVKEPLAFVLWGLSVALVAWQVRDPLAPSRATYLALTCSLPFLAITLGRYGAQLTFPIEKRR